MAHRATLQLKRSRLHSGYEILKMDYEFNQSLNLGPVNSIFPIPNTLNNGWQTFRSSTTNVTGGNINLTIATPPDTDTIFHRWMFSRWRTIDGTIRVEMDTANGIPRTLHIRFTGGYCTKLKDSFDSQNGETMTTEITISCQQIEIGTNRPAVWPAFT